MKPLGRLSKSSDAKKNAKDPDLYRNNMKTMSPQKLYVGTADLKIRGAAFGLVLFPELPTLVPREPGFSSFERQV